MSRTHPKRLRGLVPLVLLAAGCTVQQVGRTPSGTPAYERLALTYRTQEVYRILTPEAQAEAVRTVAHTSDVEGEVQTAVAVLTIEYPHPDGRPDMARAVLRLVPEPPGAPVVGQDAVATRLPWTDRSPGHAAEAAAAGPVIGSLDFPRGQLDQLVLDLAHSGFFEDATISRAAARLDVQIDKGSVAKNWSPIPRLDDYAARAYNAQSARARMVLPLAELDEPPRPFEPWAQPPPSIVSQALPGTNGDTPEADGAPAAPPRRFQLPWARRAADAETR